MPASGLRLTRLHACGECRHCPVPGMITCVPGRQMMSMQLPGAYADLTVAGEGNLYPLADTLADADAALAEPLAVCVHAVEVGRKTASRPIAEERCVVLGGGAIGGVDSDGSGRPGMQGSMDCRTECPTQGGAGKSGCGKGL